MENVKKEKIKLLNGLTIVCYEKEEIGATTGTKRKFSIMQIKECKKEILFMTKLLEQNGNVVNSNWGW